MPKVYKCLLCVSFIVSRRCKKLSLVVSCASSLSSLRLFLSSNFPFLTPSFLTCLCQLKCLRFLFHFFSPSPSPLCNCLIEFLFHFRFIHSQVKTQLFFFFSLLFLFFYSSSSLPLCLFIHLQLLVNCDFFSSLKVALLHLAEHPPARNICKLCKFLLTHFTPNCSSPSKHPHTDFNHLSSSKS